ncbi:MAG: hypothetical protein HQM16_17770 [Deltaproteobacteria bacterium]|nr:hypothetical protein [Deltaproteobacteria bacterium]
MGQKPLHLHHIFQSGFSLESLQSSLTEMEKSDRALTTERREEISQHLDKIADLYQSKKLDTAAAQSWLNTLDQYVRSGLTLNDAEMAHIRSQNNCVTAPLFDQKRFLNNVSPFALKLTDKEAQKIEPWLKDIDFFGGDLPDLPQEIAANASPDLLSDYAAGKKLLDGLLIDYQARYNFTLSGEQTPSYEHPQLRSSLSESLVTLTRKNYYRQTLARALSPNAHETELVVLCDQAARSQNPEAGIFLIANFPFVFRNETSASGLAVPLREYHTTMLGKIDEWRSFARQWVSSNCGGMGGYAHFCQFDILDLSQLVSWPDIIDDALRGLANQDTGSPEGIDLFLNTLCAAAQTISDFRSTGIEERFEAELQKLPLTKQLEEIAALGDHEKLLSYVLSIDFALKRQSIILGKIAWSLIGGEFNEFAQAWFKSSADVLKTHGLTDTYKRRVKDKVRHTPDEAGTAVMLERMPPADVKYHEVNVSYLENGFTATCKDSDIKMTVILGKKLAVKGNKKDFTLTLPHLDPISQAKQLKRDLYSVPFFKKLPKTLRDLLENHIIKDYLLEDYKRCVPGMGAGFQYTEDNNLNQRLAEVEQNLTDEFNTINAENYQAKTWAIWTLVKNADIRKASLNPLKTVEKPDFIGKITQYCKDSVAAIDRVGSPAYISYMRFLCGWVNITRSLPVKVRQVPFEPYLAKFPAPLLTKDNIYHAGEVLALLKPIGGNLYGDYIDGIAAALINKYLKPVTVDGLAEATLLLDELYAYCGNDYASNNFKTFSNREQKDSSFNDVKTRSNPMIELSGLVQIHAKDGPNCFDSLFEHLRTLVQETIAPITTSYKEREAFLKGLTDDDEPRAELLFNQYRMTLTTELDEESGLADDIRDVADLAKGTDWGSISSITDSAGVLAGSVARKGANVWNAFFGANEAWRREMFEGQVATPVKTGVIRGNIPRYQFALKDGTALGVMYEIDMSTKKFKAEMLGDCPGEEHWSTERVIQERPNMAIETVGVYADNKTEGPAWAMGLTTKKGEHKVLSSFWNSNINGVLILTDDLHSFDIRHRREVVGGFDQRTRFMERFQSGEIDNYAQAQLLIYNGGNEYNGRPIVTPDNTYQDKKSILGVSKDRKKLYVIKITESVTFYEAHAILAQLGIDAAVNLDKWGGLHDHTVDAAGKHQLEGSGDNGFSRFVVSVD